MKKIMRWIDLSAVLAMIIVSILADFIPIGGITTKEISDKYPTLFTPAPYTFAIWGIIYALCVVYVISWFTKDRKDKTENNLSGTGPLFAISCLLNLAWIFVWHNEMMLTSVVLILLLLVSLILITLLKRSREPNTGFLYSIAFYGFDVYLGWVTAATIANISVWLVSVKWGGWRLTPTLWTIVALALGAVIGILFTIIGRHLLSTLAVCWAYIGILIRHISVDGFNKRYPVLITCITICIAAMLTAVIVNILLNRKDESPESESYY